MTKRFSISVSGATYGRLRSAVNDTSLQKFVDGIVTTALGDPTILARVVAKAKPSGGEK